MCKKDVGQTCRFSADRTEDAAMDSEWTQNEICAFNIEVETVDVPTFFNITELPAATVSDVILNNLNLRPPTDKLSKSYRQFFQYLREAETAEESALDDFAAFILSLLHYYDKGRFIRREKKTTFYMGGKLIIAEANVSLVNEKYDVLLVQNNKDPISTEDVKPKLIADCIAAFAQNHLRKVKVGLPTPEAQTVFGISMLGTAPFFYRIPVSTSLLDALVTSTYPAEKTVVFRYIPRVPDQAQYRYEGMRPLDNRRIVFRCFEALKGLIRANANITSGDPEPQLIAESIAAFYSNCQKRREMPEEEGNGSSKTRQAPLLDALATSTYPAEKTVVLRYIPPVPVMEDYQAEGMQPLPDNRRIIFQCFEAFKRVILTCINKGPNLKRL
ncbi:hypothetical protein BJ912DRAFT_1044019 [Pholiota molesta]|nr:hypothetical protein BJ912DRAFT_1044019 [Pholiota molesta]